MAVFIFFWIIGQYFNPIEFFSKLLFPDLNIFNGFFNIFSWQIIWFSGLMVGLYKHFKIKILMVESRYFVYLLILALIIFFLIKHNIVLNEYDFSKYTSRQKLGWIRLLNFWMLVLVIGHYMNVLIPQNGIPWLKYLGKYSLQVFSFHILFLYFFAPYAYYLILSYGGFGFLLSVFIMLSSLTIPAYMFENIKKFKLFPSK